MLVALACERRISGGCAPQPGHRADHRHRPGLSRDAASAGQPGGGAVALAIVLLAGAGLLARSVGALLDEDGGYDAGRVVTARLMLDDIPFPDDSALVDFVNRLLGEVRALPTVTAAGVGSMLPPADAPISINLAAKRCLGFCYSPPSERSRFAVGVCPRLAAQAA